MEQSRLQELSYLVRTNNAIHVIATREKIQDLATHEDRYTLRELVDTNYFEYISIVDSNKVLVKALHDIKLCVLDPTQQTHIRTLQQDDHITISLDPHARENFFNGTEHDIHDFISNKVINDIQDLSEAEMHEMITNALAETLKNFPPASGSFGYNYDLPDSKE